MGGVCIFRLMKCRTEKCISRVLQGVSTSGSDYKVTIFGKTVNAYCTEDMCSINDYDSFSVYDFDDDLEEAVHLLITLLLNGYEPSYIHDILMECIDNGVSDEDDFEDETPEILLHWSDDVIIDAANLALEVNDWDAEEIPEEVETLPDGTHYEQASQYTVEIPDDMFFIDADSDISEELAVTFVDSVCSVYTDYDYHGADKNLYGKKNYLCKDIAEGRYSTEDIYIPNNCPEYLEELLVTKQKEFVEDLYNKRETLINNISCDNGWNFYSRLDRALGGQEKASLWLAEHGIDGMTYEGGRDHGCFVIYNCDKLKIVAEY